MNLKQQRAAALKAAQDIVAKARAAARDLTTEEAQEIEAKTAEIKRLDEQIAEAAKSAALVAQIGALGADSDGEPATQDGDAPAKSLGEHFAKSVTPAQLSALKSKATPFSVAAPEFKAATDPNLVGAAFGAALTDVDKTIVRTFRRPTISDVLGSGSITGTAITYYVEGAVEGALTSVAEGGQKPQLHFVNPTPVTDNVKKIAGWWDTSDEMIEDVPFMVSEINNRGLYLLALAEENQLLNGDGTGSNVLGILNRSGIQTVTQAAAPDTAQDAIFRASTAVQTATGLSADAILINPADYQALRLAKDANGQYYGGGFFYGEYGVGNVEEKPPLWGLRTIVTAAVPAKTVVVGAFRAVATVYRKGGVRVESTNSDLGKFTKDITTTRIEERLALALRIPSAIVKVTLL